MLVLIDESGDSGFKIAKGSSSHFVIVMVVFDDYEVAENTSNAINDTRTKLRFKTEFKFSNSSNAVRTGFFRSVSKYPFTVRALVADKSIIYSEKLRSEKESFYNYFVKSLLKNDNGILVDANIKIDGSGSKEFKKNLNSYLRNQLSQKKIKKFKFVDSKSDNLIQLADMCAGAVQRACRSDEKRNDEWLRILRDANCIDDIWYFK